MKILLTFLIITNASALEIQCDSIWNDILVVLKKSPATNVSYLLFLGEKDLEKYYVIYKENYTYTGSSFHFEDEQTSINVNLNTTQGEISSTSALFRGEGNLPLTNCQSF